MDLFQQDNEVVDGNGLLSANDEIRRMLSVHIEDVSEDFGRLVNKLCFSANVFPILSVSYDCKERLAKIDFSASLCQNTPESFS